MPRPKGSTAARADSRQNTLSFAHRANKVTKPSALASKSAKAAEEKKTLEPSKEIEHVAPQPPSPEDAVELAHVEDDDKPTTAEPAIRAPAAKGKRGGPALSASEEKASKITDAQIERYWKAKESERKAPRVHQEGLTVHDKLLREFDLSYQFGPCIGIARMKRWKRAERLGLKPPLEVLAVLFKEDAKDNAKVQRAYVDELMSSRFTLD